MMRRGGGLAAVAARPGPGAAAAGGLEALQGRGQGGKGGAPAASTLNTPSYLCFLPGQSTIADTHAHAHTHAQTHLAAVPPASTATAAEAGSGALITAERAAPRAACCFRAPPTWRAAASASATSACTVHVCVCACVSAMCAMCVCHVRVCMCVMPDESVQPLLH